MSVTEILKQRAIERLEKNKEFMSETKLKLYKTILLECTDINILRDLADNELDLELQKYLYKINENEEFEPKSLGDVEKVLSKKYNQTKMSIIHNNTAMVNDIDDEALLEIACKIYMHEQEENREEEQEDGVSLEDLDKLDFSDEETGEENEEEAAEYDEIDNIDFSDEETGEENEEETAEEEQSRESEEDSIVDFGMTKEEFDREKSKNNNDTDGVSLDDLDELDKQFNDEINEEDNFDISDDDIFIEEDEEEAEEDNFESNEDMFIEEDGEEAEEDNFESNEDIFVDSEYEIDGEEAEEDNFESIDNIDTDDMFDEDNLGDEEESADIDSINTDDMFVDNEEEISDIDDMDTDDMFDEDNLGDEEESADIDSINTDDMFADDEEESADIDNINTDDMFADDEDESDIEEHSNNEGKTLNKQSNNPQSIVNKNRIFDNGTDRGRKTQDTFNALSSLFGGTSKIIKKAGSKINKMGKSDFFKP